MTDDPIVATAAGRVRGRWRAQPDGAGESAAFLGIPFAQAPVGALRFAAPVPMEPWPGVRDALEHGATAQRWTPDAPTLIPEPSIPGESTLNVNVFTPRPGDEAARLPVLVWIHGGGYVAGSPASPWYDGRAFTRDGIVTVTISYRLGFDGFGWIDGGVQNRGVRDWLAALDWVQRNIAAFGGDPGDVTIAGQSAGGGAVLTLLGLPAAQPLFHRAIAISAALADTPQARARQTSARLAALLGVAPDAAGFRAASEQQVARHQVPAAQSTARGLAALRAALDAAVPYGPVIDGELLTRTTPDAIAAGVGAATPLLLGSTDDEFAMITRAHAGQLRLVPAGLALRALGLRGRARRDYLQRNRAVGSTAEVLGRFVSDRVFRSLVVRIAQARGAAPTWAYRFAWRSRSRGIALHCLDVPFWFDCLASERVDALAGEHPPQPLADALHGTAAAMIRDGDPGWTAWSAEPGATRVFDDPAPAPAVLPDGYASVRPLL